VTAATIYARLDVSFSHRYRFSSEAAATTVAVASQAASAFRPKQ
jgi:hypothetical protein